MLRMFTAVAALVPLILGAVARGDVPENDAEPCYDDPPESHPVSWGVPNCENAAFIVWGQGASEVHFSGSAQDGWDVHIRARFNSGTNKYYGVSIQPQHAGVKFNSIIIAPDELGPSNLLSYPVELAFTTFPPMSVGRIGQHTITQPLEPDIYVPVTLVNGVSPWDVAGDVGELDVTVISTFQIGGNLGIADENQTSVARVRGRIEVGQNPGLTIGGDLLAKLVITNDHPTYMNSDSIGLLVVEGDIGLSSPTTAAEEAAGRIETKNDIGTIEAGAVYADILPGAAGSGVKNIHRLLVRKIESSSGDFFGNLVANEILHLGSGSTTVGGTIAFEGDFGGTVTLLQPIVNPPSIYSLNSPPIVIDGGMVEGTRNPTAIVLPEDGLQGQILINRAFDGGDWEVGVVDVDGTEIDLPNYTTLPSAVGGGLVGLAPFDLHREACEPAHQATVAVQSLGHASFLPCEEQNPLLFSIKACYVQHYGPVVDFGTDMPVEVYVKPTDSSYGWTDVTSQYKASIVSDTRSARLKVERIDEAGFPTDFHYRITPKPDELRCRFVEGEPDVKDYNYYFTLVWTCDQMLMLGTFDLNNDELVNLDDLAAWLAAPVDLNEDSVADTEDMLLMLEAISAFEE